MKNIKFLVVGGVIAALYATLCVVFAPISFGPIQFRIAEGLTVLPFFSGAAVPGLFIGCVIANLFSPFGILDVIVGSIASLIGAIGTYLIGKRLENRRLAIWLAPMPPVVSNAILVGAMLSATSGQGMYLGTFLAFAGQVFIGELAVCYVLGIPLILWINRIQKKKKSLWF